MEKKREIKILKIKYFKYLTLELGWYTKTDLRFERQTKLLLVVAKEV